MPRSLSRSLTPKRDRRDTRSRSPAPRARSRSPAPRARSRSPVARARSRSPARPERSESPRRPTKPLFTEKTVPHSNDLFSIMLTDLPMHGRSAIRDSSDILPYFEKFGKIGDIFLPIDRRNGELRGFSFVRFYEERDRDDALDYYEKKGLRIGDQEVKVELGRKRKPIDLRDTIGPTIKRDVNIKQEANVNVRKRRSPPRERRRSPARYTSRYDDSRNSQRSDDHGAAEMQLELIQLREENARLNHIIENWERDRVELEIVQAKYNAIIAITGGVPHTRERR